MSRIISYAIRRQILPNSIRNYAGSAAVAGDHSGGYKVWKRLTFFVGLPAIGLCMLNAYLKHHEQEHEEVRPPFIKYEYMYRREKRFPWGDGNKSLFHNPRKNALPDGYEE